VGNESTYLNGEGKIIGGGFFPCDKSFLRGEMIKTVVKLYSVEPLGVKLQPFRLRQRFRVKKATPMVIIPAATPNTIVY